MRSKLQTPIGSNGINKSVGGAKAYFYCMHGPICRKQHESILYFKLGR